jgi:hypothetical protein
MSIAKCHSEFFRVYDGREGPSASLVARHVMGPTNAEEGRRLPADFVNELVHAAIRLHDGQLQRRQVCSLAWVGGIILALPALASFIQSLLSISVTMSR